MPLMNQKNMMLSPAAIDLGLGASLQTQVQDEIEEIRKRRKQQNTGMLLSPAGVTLLQLGGLGGSQL